MELLDLVEYEANGKTKQIRGMDRLVGGQFIWRGIGIMKILSSRWQVVTIKGDVLVIRFEKNLRHTSWGRYFNKKGISES